MELKTNNSRVLMSDALRDQLPEGDDSQSPFDELQNNAVYVVIDRRVGGLKKPITGVLSSVLFGVEPEIEVMVSLESALETVQAERLEILGIELQHGENVTVPMPGPFNVKVARIDKIDVIQQSCILGMQLQRVPKR